MGDHSCAHHVQIDVGHTAVQVRIVLNRCCVIAIFPECALSQLATVVLLRRASGSQLHAACGDVVAFFQDEQVEVMM